MVLKAGIITMLTAIPAVIESWTMMKFRGLEMTCDIETHSLTSPSLSLTDNSSLVKPSLTTI